MILESTCLLTLREMRTAIILCQPDHEEQKAVIGGSDTFVIEKELIAEQVC